MNSLERILTTLQFKEPDRVPFLLLLSLHGAKELNLSIEDYFSKPENIAEGQRILREKYQHDCYDAFYYASIEMEAWGGTTIFFEDNAPNAGVPIIRKRSDILHLNVPDISKSEPLQRVLKSIQLLKPIAKDEVPIIGVVMSPFSLPIMQLGFEEYIKLIYEDKDLFEHLMTLNMEFCVNWANAQLESGATAICYFDPMSSPTMISPEDYVRTGQRVATDTIAQFKGPSITHFASGRSLGVAESLTQTGTVGIGVGCDESLTELKNTFYEKLTIIGNLNGIEMCSWDEKTAEAHVKSAIDDAAKGGGFILSDVHGEIPYQVEDKILIAIRDSVFKWGQYKS